MLPPPPTWLTTASTMQSMKASERSCSIRITFIWIRILPPPIATRATSRKRSRSTPNSRRQRSSRAAGLPLPTRMGRQVEARNILTQLLQAREKRYVSAPVIAAVYVALGDKEEAFRWLERAFTEHSGILQWIAFLPEFRPLHSDARFPHLLRRIGASHDQ